MGSRIQLAQPVPQDPDPDSEPAAAGCDVSAPRNTGLLADQQGASVAFRAVHAEWGTVFAHLPDLGCERSWEAVWRIRPPVLLACDECGHAMYAKTSRTGLRFFAHAPGAPACALALESVAHHLLKLELTNAARDAGAHAELEARGPDSTWRADVLATDPAGTWATALEAQLAPITDVGIAARTEKMRASGVTSIWFSDRPRPPWLGAVPSVRLERSECAEHLSVAEGLVKFTGYGWDAVPASLTEFLTWAFAHRIVTHAPRTPLRYPQRSLATVWTAPQYIRAETAHLEEEERLRRVREARAAALQREKEKKREEIRARNVVTRAKALAEATTAEQAARAQPPGRLWQVARVFRLGVDRALAKLADEHGVIATVGFSTGDPRYAGGVPLVDEHGVPAAVFDPDPGRIRGEAFLLLAGLLLIFPSKTDQRRFENASNIKKKHRPVDGYRVEFIETPLARGRGSPRLGQPLLRLRHSEAHRADPERGVPGRAERADGVGHRALPSPMPGVRGQIRETMASDGQHTHQLDKPPRKVKTHPRNYWRITCHLVRRSVTAPGPVRASAW